MYDASLRAFFDLPPSFVRCPSLTSLSSSSANFPLLIVYLMADKVYLFSRSKDDSASDRMKQVQKALEKHSHIEVHDVYVNIWGLFICLEKFREVFDSENKSNNHLYVNVSTGSKIISIAGMIACMLWKETPYYAKLNYEDGGPSVSIDKHKVMKTEFLPVYQINMPTLESLQVLSIIRENKGKISKKRAY
jgi:hypothetical protein